MKKILFISHNASNTGAPILLLRLINELLEKVEFTPIILLNHGGELKHQFEKLGKVYEWNPVRKDRITDELAIRILNKFKIKVNSKIQQHRNDIINKISKVDLVFNNTIANGDLLELLNLENKIIISYLHELEVGIKIDSSPEKMKLIHDKSNYLFVPSLAVKDNLVNGYNYNSKKITILKYIIPELDLGNDNSDLHFKQFNSLNKSFIVSFCGTLDWRKGCDLVPLIMNLTFTKFPTSNILFQWIGADLSSKEYLVLMEDLSKLNLQYRITFIEKQENIQKYLKNSSILLLPSREDAFPLVVLEAAQYKVPCIYFREAGGIFEFLGTDAGIPIDYLDIDEMVNNLGILASNNELLKKFGIAVNSKILAYASDAKQMKPLLDIINN